jgi:hypothetical protein
MLIRTPFIGRFIGVVDTMSLSNCRTVTCPLAQSEERIHGKEKLGGYSPRPVTSRNSRLCRSMPIIASGSSCSDWQQVARLATNADEFRDEIRTNEPVHLWGRATEAKGRYRLGPVSRSGWLLSWGDCQMILSFRRSGGGAGQCTRAWLSSSERPRCRPSMIDQNREHLMGSLAGHCRPCSSAVRATSIRCCCSASSANL